MQILISWGIAGLRGHTMEKIRLSTLRRSLLRAASHGRICVATGRSSSAARATCAIAARRLAQLGLGTVHLAPGLDGIGIRRRSLLHFEITDLGRRVVATYAREFETGGRIRWARLNAASDEMAA